MPGRVMIFANPVAGRGRGTATARRVEQHLKNAGFEPVVCFDRPAGPVAVDVSAVITIGGDGTLRDAVDHLFGQSPDGPPVLPISMGTANLMGRHLGYRWTPATLGPMVVRTLTDRRIVRLDAGRANGKLFLLMAGIGLDGAVVHELARKRTGPIAMASYLLPLATSVMSYRFPEIAIEVDGVKLVRGEPAIAIVGNVREYGIGLPVVPAADPTDGLLDVCVLPCRGWTDLAEIAIGLATQTHHRRAGVTYVTGRSIRVESAETVPVQIDGDAAGFTPLAIEILPARVPFFLPG